MGFGDWRRSDQAAVETMRKCMDTVPIDGTIVIGEGERDEAPMLFIGEKVGIAAHKESAAADLPEGRHRGRSAGGHEPLRDRGAERDGGARGVEPRRAAARARSLHGKARRRPDFQARRQPRRERGREPRRPSRRPSIGTSRTSSSSSWIGRGTRRSSRTSGARARASGSSATATSPRELRRRWAGAASMPSWASAARRKACSRRRRCGV